MNEKLTKKQIKLLKWCMEQGSIHSHSRYRYYKWEDGDMNKEDKWFKRMVAINELKKAFGEPWHLRKVDESIDALG
jgi:hypothetical protein